MARKKIVAGNWKMNKTPSEAVALVEELKPLVANEDVDVVFCVPAIDIIPVPEPGLRARGNGRGRPLLRLRRQLHAVPLRPVEGNRTAQARQHRAHRSLCRGYRLPGLHASDLRHALAEQG